MWPSGQFESSDATPMTPWLPTIFRIARGGCRGSSYIGGAGQGLPRRGAMPSQLANELLSAIFADALSDSPRYVDVVGLACASPHFRSLVVRQLKQTYVRFRFDKETLGIVRLLEDVRTAPQFVFSAAARSPRSSLRR